MAEQIGKNRARFTLREAANAVEGKYVGVKEEALVGVATDSRSVEEGNLYIALKGEKFDGHNFLREVAEKNAAAVLICDSCDIYSPHIVVDDTLVALGKLAQFHRKRFQIPLVAVTGSYGKTSTRALIFAALSTQFDTLTSQGNFNNEIGLPMTLFQLETHHEAAVVEMGMRGRGQIEYLAKIAEPTVGVITNIGPQHIELLGSIEEIAAAKAELLENLPENGIAVLPADSPLIDFLKSKAKCRVVTFGTSENADYRVTQIESDAEGNIGFVIVWGGNPDSNDGNPDSNDGNPNVPTDIGVSVRDNEVSVPDIGVSVPDAEVSDFDAAFSAMRADISAFPSVPFTTPIALSLPGAHNAINAAAAFAVALELGVSPEDAARGLESAQLPGARMRVLKLANGITLIDDCYNAGPDSMRAALQTLLDFPGSGRKVAVLGAMKELGEHSEAEHRKIGVLAGQFVEVLIGVGGETRPLLNFALPSAREIESEMPVFYCDNAKEAASRVGEWLQNGDVVLIKGSRSVGLEIVVEAVTNLK